MTREGSTKRRRQGREKQGGHKLEKGGVVNVCADAGGATNGEKDSKMHVFWQRALQLRDWGGIKE